MLYKWVQIIDGWLDWFSLSWEGCISGLKYLLVGWMGCWSVGDGLKVA